ncbi:NACHT, LRR and PYD domains-containing protein 14-like isoform X2 [Dysidea avara]|uniref:NACHT, LRR and PYD domains-containing protein 14-like isoform X2 n=1 Tax=Dysidea avara TaxID=196820 RepID=UPI003333CA00
MTTNPYFVAFNMHYQDLTTALPANAMYPTFVRYEMLKDPQLNQQFIAASTNEAKTRVLLDSMRGGLQIGVVSVFQQFLKAMTEYAEGNSDPVVKKLVKNINKDLPSDLGRTDSDLPSSDFEQCKAHLKSCYLNRPEEPNRWHKLGGLEVYFEIAIRKSRYLSDKFHVDCAMDVIKDKMEHVTVEEILIAGQQKITLIEGDPGSGKTKMTIHICKQWAEGKLLLNELVFLIPLCSSYYQTVTSLNELFDACSCSVLTEYAKRNYGKGFVFILDGWDELPERLQLRSFYHDIIFRKTVLTCSTIIVTSRSSCSDRIAQAVQDHYYRILGFTPKTAKIYVDEHFKNLSLSKQVLLTNLQGHDYFHQDFHVPITILIMCFICCYDSYLPKPTTSSKLYERFVLLFMHSNIPGTYGKTFKSLHNVPKDLNPLFSKLCSIALRMVISEDLQFNKEELEDDLKHLPFKSSDAFGLLSSEHGIDEFAGKQIHCSFIHRLVQELLAALSVVESQTVEHIIDQHFHEGSFLINVFPFVFGLMDSSTCIDSLTSLLVKKYLESNKSNTLLITILHCLFEAQNAALCYGFASVFHNENGIDLSLQSDLEYLYATYFFSVCGCAKLTIKGLWLTDTRAESMAQYLCNPPIPYTEIISLSCEGVDLSEKGVKALNKLISHQDNFNSLKIHVLVCYESNVKVIYDSIWKCYLVIDTLIVINHSITKGDLDCLGEIVSTVKFIDAIIVYGSYFGEGVSPQSSDSFCNSLCSTKSLKWLSLHLTNLSCDNIAVLGRILVHNSCLEILDIGRVNAMDSLVNICDGLSSTKTLQKFSVHLDSADTSFVFEKRFAKCLTSNQSLTLVDFTGIFGFLCIDEHVQWSSSQVCFFCSGLQSNSTVTLLDITGCYIDKTASDSVSKMLSVNTSLRHLFLNPVHMEKPDAVMIIESCKTNTELEILSLHCNWLDDQSETNKFTFATDPKICEMVGQVQNSRQDKMKPNLHIIWELKEYCEVKSSILVKSYQE